MFVGHIASQSRTPPHYMDPAADRLSGESIKSAETGLVAKVQRKMRHFGESHEEVMRLAFLAEGDDRAASAFAMETIWRDPEIRTESEHVDALLKQQAFGVPNEVLQEKAGYSPIEVARNKKIQAEERAAAPVPVMVPVAVPAGSQNGGSS